MIGPADGVPAAPNDSAPGELRQKEGEIALAPRDAGIPIAAYGGSVQRNLLAIE